VLQVVAGLDGEALEAFLIGAPVQLQAVQRLVEGASIQQPAAQDLFTLPGLFRRHLHQGTGGAALHPDGRRRLGIRSALEREPLHRRLLALFLGLGAAQGQGIGQFLTFGIEHPQVAQVRVAGRHLQAER